MYRDFKNNEFKNNEFKNKENNFNKTNVKKYKVYSDVLGKPFDSVEALEAAEAAVLKEEEEKKKAATIKKTAADVVKVAIVKRVEAEAAARKAKTEAYEKYLKELDAIDAKVADAKTAESEALKTFCEKYGSFHDTITIGDVTYNCNYETNVSYVDPIRKLLDSFWL